MKKTILSLVFLFVTNYAFSQDQLSISFSKNSSGELIMTVEGHTTPIVVSVGENKITLHVIENKINLTALGVNDLTQIAVEETPAKEESKEENVEEVETAAGTSTAAADTQTVIPPVNPSINPNPPLSTPF